MAYKYKKLRGIIVERYGSQSEFSKVIGVSKQSVSKKINGKTEFSQTDIRKWSEPLDIAFDDYGKYFFT